MANLYHNTIEMDKNWFPSFSFSYEKPRTIFFLFNSNIFRLVEESR